MLEEDEDQEDSRTRQMLPSPKEHTKEEKIRKQNSGKGKT